MREEQQVHVGLIAGNEPWEVVMQITQRICEAQGKSPVDGVYELMRAAAVILEALGYSQGIDNRDMARDFMRMSQETFADVLKSTDAVGRYSPETLQ